MGSSIPDDWKLRGQAAGRQHLTPGEVRELLLTVIEGQPDLTLDEVVCAMRKRKLSGSRTAVWRFFQRHKITFKKKPERGGAAARRRGAGAATLDARTGHV
jgi:transposase